ncbi:MAG: hypothetical protein HYU31_05180 [Deltaproteobacteria bacterium]|nr:hypothetical protein [Deltaproteobacteria bacterium]MBI2180195.1 hypothetical protein [Deltaproteobacteria bacterium]MBI2227665.1 hypothetical protein [Deltaproteobacteria bacterium]MBI2534763.1 hypothetical protein [Deltaproteobacteria bacterium]
MENLGTIILATGALGTAAFGIVEALKWTRLGEAGFRAILKVLGPIIELLRTAYGPDFQTLLRAQYRGDQRDLTRVIRQGVRVGLTVANANQAARFLGMIDGERLTEAARQVEEGQELSAELRNVLGRFELAVDTRIDAALMLAKSRYVGATRVTASMFAILIAVAVGAFLGEGYMFQAILVGIAAVPLAPVAKDLVSALQSASKAIRLKP